MRTSGRVMVLGTIPEPLRRRFDLPFGRRDRAAFEALRVAIQQGARFVPKGLHRRALRNGLRFIGEATREERFVPPIRLAP